MSEILAEVWVPGRPRPKGSLHCRGGRSHSMEEDNPESKPWRIKMAGALRADRDARCGERSLCLPWHGAAEVTFCAFFDPISEGAELLGAPLRPIDGGDKDKLERNILDALQDGTPRSPAVLGNDSLVVSAMGEKVFTYEQGEQGIWIRVTTVDDAELIRRRRTRNAALEHLRAQLGITGPTGF